MEIIRFADLEPEPWRNGGGVTRELVSHPLAASAQDGVWDWRVSIADLTKAGDFSPFPGMERVLTVVEGELLLLNVGGSEHPLEKYRPFRFSGEAASSATLPTGDIRNLNVITRAGAYKGYTSIVELSKKRPHPLFAGQLGVLLQGEATAKPGGALVAAAPDAAVLDESATGETAAAGIPETEDTGTDAGLGASEPLSRYDAVVGSDTRTPEILGRGFLGVVSIDALPA
jgi:environmental stress-induced protein Ves